MGDDAARVSRILMNLAAFVIIVAGLRAASELLVPFLLALFLAILCATPLRWLTDHFVPRVIAVIVLVAVSLAVGIGIGGILTTAIDSMSRPLERRPSRRPERGVSTR